MEVTEPRIDKSVLFQETCSRTSPDDSKAHSMPEYEPLAGSGKVSILQRWFNVKSFRSVPKKGFHVRTISASKRRRRKHLTLAACVGLVWSVYLLFFSRLDWSLFRNANIDSIIVIVTTVTTRMLKSDQDQTLDELLWHWGFPTARAAELSKASSSLTLNMVPQPIHSHNDYWRRHPLFDAIEYGAKSVEADVWLSNVTEEGVVKQDLLVGHKTKDLNTDRTLRSLYLDPLSHIITRQNSPDTMRNRKVIGSSGFQGVYDTCPDTPLGLLIDVKSDGTTTLPVVLGQLQPLRDKGWLTYFNHTSQKVVQRPLIVIMSGRSVFKEVLALPLNATTMHFRDVFFDAPLDKLGDADKGKPAGHFVYNTTNSWYASVAFGESIRKTGMGGLTPSQAARVKNQVDAARTRGLVSRYYDTPTWPSGTRNVVWRDLVNAGVGILSVDNLKAAQKFFRERDKDRQR